MSDFKQFNLKPVLLNSLESLAFTEPTPVQQQTIPAALKHQDLLVSAKTGSGKTAAFLLPTLNRLLDKPEVHGGTRALILAPTRELAQQLVKQAKKMAGSSRLLCGLITGGDSFKYQASFLRKNPEIVVATPGRLLEHLERDTPDFSTLEVLVLDEADRMLDMGFADDVLTIVSNCNKDNRQTLLFSATLKKRGLQDLIDFLLVDPKTIDVDQVRQQHDQIHQQMILGDDAKHKSALTDSLLHNETFEKALIFTNTRIQADSLGSWLKYKNHRIGVLHGDMTQDDRNHVMQAWRKGNFKTLVATDVAARGLDIPAIDLVINFDVPRNGDDYIHRIGRTGRAGQQGLAITLVEHNSWNTLTRIQHYLHLSMEKRTLPGLVAKYKGPKKLKASGKAASSLKRDDKQKPKTTVKKKQRHRDTKNIGKRRKPSANAGQEGGFAPPKKRPPSES